MLIAKAPKDYFDASLVPLIFQLLSGPLRNSKEPWKSMLMAATHLNSLKKNIACVQQSNTVAKKNTTIYLDFIKNILRFWGADQIIWFFSMLTMTDNLTIESWELFDFISFSEYRRIAI